MRRNSIIAILVLIGVLVSPMEADAKKSSKNVRDLYVFALSMSFSDSVMYMSNIQKLDGIVFRDKYIFDEWADYAAQFKKWMEEETSSEQLSVLYYCDDKKKAERKRTKVCRLAIRKHGGKIITVPDFKFNR